MISEDTVVEQLRKLARAEELPKVRKRLSADEPAFGVRMRDLFQTARASRDMGLAQVGRLLDHPAYEPRMVAFCILDFKARRSIDAALRRELRNVYVNRHDRITTWDMVDRAAPRVVGASVCGGPYDVLHELAESSDSLRRRSAITAALYFVRGGEPADVDVGFDLAQRLLTAPEPVVHNAVGIFLKHAGSKDPNRLRRLLSAHAAQMPRACLRLAVEKLGPEERSRYLAIARHSA